jgi:hypothetical protein
MTDPLTAKELVEKSYEYIDRLARECSKLILDDYNKTHKKFAPETVTSQVGTDVVSWFQKRDKNVTFALDPSSPAKGQQNQYHLKFKGKTKDADFELGGVVSTFIQPGSEYTGSPICFVKTIRLDVDKTKFTRRK